MNAQQAITLESVPSVKASDVMKTAWWLAKMVAKEYGVSSKSLLSAALKKVWSKVSVKVSIFNAYEDRRTLAIIGFVFNKENKAWEKEMFLGDFNKPNAQRFGKGFITAGTIESAFSNKHSVKFA